MDSTILMLRVAPKSAQDAVVGWQGEVLKVKVRAVPENGRANEAVIAVLAKALEVPKTAIVIESGQASRNKRVRITGLSAEAIRRRFVAAKPQTP
jgi:uncharacterized protein (TIGR00251 family)